MTAPACSRPLPVAAPRLGDIGTERREVEFAPLDEPAPPDREPVPAPAAPVPEQVPAGTP